MDKWLQSFKQEHSEEAVKSTPIQEPEHLSTLTPTQCLASSSSVCDMPVAQELDTEEEDIFSDEKEAHVFPKKQKLSKMNRIYKYSKSW
ncbi:hypothetical protein WA026_015790 [Henosepilachna vigintioctopunctata]|uniref:Uncharacterized protein n=1 Tax=Henosepilachna vigintioctopunctata TaxID=420089 RepID=A0AAW1USZ3_9CUCU